MDLKNLKIPLKHKEKQALNNQSVQDQIVQLDQILSDKLNKKFKFTKKNLIIMLIILVLILGSVYILLTYVLKTPNPITNLNSKTTSSDIYIRDNSGNIKKQLIINSSNYTSNMDILGSWSESLENSQDRTKYQALLTPGSNIEDAPQLAIRIIKTSNASTQDLEKKILDEFKKDVDDFELKNISSNKGKYIINYTSSDGKLELRNYSVVEIQSGYEVIFTYSAINPLYSKYKGYVDDMINSFTISKATAKDVVTD